MPEITARAPLAFTAPVQGVTPPAAVPGSQPPPNGTPAAPGQAKPPEQKSPDAQRLEALAQRESRLRREAQRVSQERRETEALKTQLLQQQQENQRLRSWAQRFYSEPIQVLNEAGVHGDVITQGLLNQPSREAVTIRQLQAQIAQLSEQNKSIETKLTDGDAQAYEQAKNQVRADTKILLSSDKTLEACTAQGEEAVEAIVELIEQTMEKEKRLMSVKEAADEVENYLIEEAAKLAALPKIQSRLTQNTTQAAGGQTQAAGGAPAGTTTLSNRSIPAPQARAKTSEKERVQRAIAAFEAARQAGARA